MSVRKETISGVKWTTVSSVVLMVVGIIKISILARYLEAEDFGLMAIVTLVLGFMNLFMDMGLTSAILHKQDITPKEYASLYWVNVIFSMLLFLIVSFSSPLIASFYSLSELTLLIPLMSISVLFSGIGNQFKTIEQKKLNFKFISTVDIITSVLSLFLAVFLAVKNHGVYALVYSALLQSGGANFIYFLKGLFNKKIKFHFNFNETKPFLKIGFFQAGGQIINYFNRDIDVLIIGKFFDSEVLGGYSLAKQLAVKPMSLFAPIISRVGSPVFAKIQKNKELLSVNFLKLVKIISTFSFTASITIIIFASQMVSIMYGEKFLFITNILRVLSLYMFLRSVSSIVGPLVIATGKTDVEFYWNLLVLFVMPLSVFISSQFGSIEIVSITMLITMFCLVLVSWKIFVSRLIEVKPVDYFKSFIPNYFGLYNLVKNIGK